MKRTLLSTLIGVMVAGVAGIASAQKISDDVVKIGVLTDLSGAYSDVAGQGAVIAAKMAVADFSKDGNMNNIKSHYASYKQMKESLDAALKDYQAEVNAGKVHKRGGGETSYDIDEFEELS